jgi:hypothetical protein
MKEEFLYYVWQYKLFSMTKLTTTNGKSIVIKKAGLQNNNAGPDFLNAQIEIDNQLWAGNVEMHLKSSDWYLHKHETDINYDAVILHVVWQHDVDVFTKSDKTLPTLELQDIVDKSILKNYEELLYQKTTFIPCGNQLKTVDQFLIDNWLERLYFERLEEKSLLINELLSKTNDNFEAVLFQLLAKNFGLKINGNAFLEMAKSIDFSIIKKTSFNEGQISALFYGQSGFLEDDLEIDYYTKLKQEYHFLQHKFGLVPISKNNFQFFRMRPPNFPTIRIAQLAALYHLHQHLFSKLMKVKSKEEVYELFEVEVNLFWKTHYTFETSSKKTNKKLSKSFIDLLLINTIIPLKFVYLKQKGENQESVLLKLIQQVAPEKNAVISKFSESKIKAKNAMESQALLMLKNNYCTKKLCLQCAIGNHLLRK